MELVAVDVPICASQAVRVQQYVTAISRHTFGCHIARSTAPPVKNGASTALNQHQLNSNTHIEGSVC
jgi:hypothetical protein